MKNILCVSLLLTAGSLQAMNKKQGLDKIRPAATPSEIKEAHQRLLNEKVGFQRIRMAITLSDTEEVRRLLQEEKQTLESSTYESEINSLESRETLLYIAAGNGDLDIVELLIDEGADVNVGNNHNSTPLHIAVWCKNPAVVALLLEKKANPNARNNNNYTPLHNAVKEYDQEAESVSHLSEIIRLLLSKGANATIVGNNPHCAIRDYCNELKGLCEKAEELRALLGAYPNCMKPLNIHTS